MIQNFFMESADVVLLRRIDIVLKDYKFPSLLLCEYGLYSMNRQKTKEPKRKGQVSFYDCYEMVLLFFERV